MALLHPKAILAFTAVAGGDGISRALGATVLEPNDVQIVAFASDSPDALAFVTWRDLDAGTEVRFTDRGWGCDGFKMSGQDRSGESELRFTAQDFVAAGSVFEYVDNATPQGEGLEWELLSGSFSLTGTGNGKGGDPGDQIIVYQGTLDDPTPIFAFDTTGGWEDCADVTDAYTSALPTGLVDGVSAVSFRHSDSFWYRPWYAKSALLDTLKGWMVNRDRFKTASYTSTRQAEYVAPLEGFTIRAGEYGSHGYTEYIPGTAPCIIVTGHDGDLRPTDIVDRTDGCYDAAADACDWSKTCFPVDEARCNAKMGNDVNTQDMARRANDYLEAHTGRACHLIVNRLARSKLDPNRGVEQAAQFDQGAIDAYNDFHSFVDVASEDIESNHPCGAGLMVDFHGHTHPEAKIELGYKLSRSQLQESDAVLDTLGYTSSVMNMPTHNNEFLSDVIRGSLSMGAFFNMPTAVNETGYHAIPSPEDPAPADDENYFQGGYNVDTHGSQREGAIDAVMIEFPSYLRWQDYAMQEDMLRAFGEVVVPGMLRSHYPAACDVLAAEPSTSPSSAPSLVPTSPAPTSSPTLHPTISRKADGELCSSGSECISLYCAGYDDVTVCTQLPSQRRNNHFQV